jgi:hypothetical protein
MSVPMREGAWQRRAPADHCAAARVAAAAGVSSLSKKEMSFADAMNTVAKQRTKGDERRSARLAKRVTTAMDANKRDIMAALKAEAVWADQTLLPTIEPADGGWSVSYAGRRLAWIELG